MATHILKLWLLMALVVGGAPLAADKPIGDWAVEKVGELERWSLVQPLDGAARLRVVNPYGDVHLRNSGPGGILDLSAAVQQLAADGRLLEPVLRLDGDLLVLEVRWAPAGREAAKADQPSRADLAVLVPEGTATWIETAAGKVDSRGLRADLDVRSTAGSVRIRGTRGAVQVRSDSGAVHVTLEPDATDRPQVIETVTGDAAVWIPAGAGLAVRLATSGAITTDFSLEIEHRDLEEPDKLARTTLGTGSATLQLRSRRGDLALRRVVPAHHIRPESDD